MSGKTVGEGYRKAAVQDDSFSDACMSELFGELFIHACFRRKKQHKDQ